MSESDPIEIQYQNVIYLLKSKSTQNVKKGLSMIKKKWSRKLERHDSLFSSGMLLEVLHLVTNTTEINNIELCITIVADCCISQSVCTELLNSGFASTFETLLHQYSNVNIVDKVARVLANLARAEPYHEALTDIKCVQKLVEVLASITDASCKVSIVRALRYLFACPSHSAQIIDSDGVLIVAEQLKQYRSSSEEPQEIAQNKIVHELVSVATQSLADFSQCSFHCLYKWGRQILESECLTTIVTLAESDNAKVSAACKLILMRLVKKQKFHGALSSSGFFSYLVKLFESSVSVSERWECVRALLWCSMKSEEYLHGQRENIWHAGALPVILQALASETDQAFHHTVLDMLLQFEPTFLVPLAHSHNLVDIILTKLNVVHTALLDEASQGNDVNVSKETATSSHLASHSYTAGVSVTATTSVYSTGLKHAASASPLVTTEISPSSSGYQSQWSPQAGTAQYSPSHAPGESLATSTQYSPMSVQYSPTSTHSTQSSPQYSPSSYSMSYISAFDDSTSSACTSFEQPNKRIKKCVSDSTLTSMDKSSLFMSEAEAEENRVDFSKPETWSIYMLRQILRVLYLIKYDDEVIDMLATSREKLDILFNFLCKPASAVTRLCDKSQAARVRASPYQMCEAVMVRVVSSLRHFQHLVSEHLPVRIHLLMREDARGDKLVSHTGSKLLECMSELNDSYVSKTFQVMAASSNMDNKIAAGLSVAFITFRTRVLHSVLIEHSCLSAMLDALTSHYAEDSSSPHRHASRAALIKCSLRHLACTVMTTRTSLDLSSTPTAPVEGTSDTPPGPPQSSVACTHRQLHKDFTFLIPGGRGADSDSEPPERLGANRQLLTKRNEYFRKLLENQDAAAGEVARGGTDVAEMEMRMVGGAVLEWVLHYLHGCPVRGCPVLSGVRTQEMLVAVMQACDEYGVSGAELALAGHTLQRVMSADSGVNVASLYQSAALYSCHTVSESIMRRVFTDPDNSSYMMLMEGHTTRSHLMHFIRDTITQWLT